MDKVRVLVLKGCKLCESLLAELTTLDNRIVTLDADMNSSLADKVEVLLATINYPIIIIDQESITTYLYRVDDSNQLGVLLLDPSTRKIGCYDVDDMVASLKKLLNK